MQIDRKTIKSLVLGLMSCILLYWFLNDMDRVKSLMLGLFEIIQPFLVGACIAFILNVPMRTIERQIDRIPRFPAKRAVSIVLTLGCIWLVVSLVVRLLVPQVRETTQIIAEQIPAFISRLETDLLKFLEANPQIEQWLWEYTDMDNLDWTAIADQTIAFVSGGLGKLLGNTVVLVRGFISSIWNIMVSVIFSLYCLSDKEQLARQGRRLSYSFLPEQWADELIRVGRLANSTFSNFFSGQCIEVLILGSMFAITMTILQMPYVPLVSVLVAVTAFIPIVGAWIGCALGAFFILVNDPMQATAFVIMFLALQQIENNLIYPRVVGTSVGLPSMWTLVAVTVGADLMGVAGMVLMIPVCSVIYTLLKEYTQKRVRDKGIDPEKLKDQRPVLKSKFREKREHIKRRRAEKAAQRAAELAAKMKEKLHLSEHHDQKE